MVKAMKLRSYVIPLILLLPCQIASRVLTEKCAIEGTVLDAGGGTPLAGAEIGIVKNEGALGSSLVVTTDANGRYAVEGIEPGRYLLVATRRGYVPQAYGRKNRSNRGITLVLDPGTRVRGIDFRLVQTGVIAGKVVDQDGEPVAGATIQALTPRYIEGERRLMGGAEPTRTNDLGEYRIFGLAPDRYYVGTSGQDPDQVVVTKPKNAVRDERYVPTLYPNVSNTDQATEIDLQSGGQVVGIDIVVLRSRTFHIRGRIAGFNKNFQQTRVQLRAAGVSWEINSRGAETAVDGQGSFEFTGVTSGSYIISATLFQRDSSSTASRLVQIQEADLDDISLIPSDGVLRGQLRADGALKIDLGKLRVRLSDPYSLPLEGVVIADGSFTLHGIRHSTYRVGILGAEDFYIKSVRIAGHEVTDDALDLSSAQEPPGILEIVLGTNAGEIDGVVINGNDSLASNAAVVLIPELTHRRVSSLFKNTTTNQVGQFAMRGIAPGNYKLFAWDDIEPGNWWNSEFLSHYEDTGQEVTIDANAHLSRRLHLISINSE